MYVFRVLSKCLSVIEYSYKFFFSMSLNVIVWDITLLNQHLAVLLMRKSWYGIQIQNRIQLSFE